MIIHTESWLILAHREITPSVRSIIDGRLAHQHQIESNSDGIRIRFATEIRAKAVWDEIEEAWAADEEPSGDDEESNQEASGRSSAAPVVGCEPSNGETK